MTTAQNAPAASSMAPDFRGSAVYSGSYEARQDNPGRSTRRNPLGLGSTQEAGGAIIVRLSFNRDVVSGDYSGATPLQSMTLNGTRSGNHCRLFTSPRPAIFEGECSPHQFTGRIVSQSGEARPFTIVVNARATQFVDAAQAERERSRQAALAAAAIPKQPQTTQPVGRPMPVARTDSSNVANRGPAVQQGRVACPAKAPTRQQLDSVIDEDSRSWLVNEYSKGSASLDGLVSGSYCQGNYSIKVKYTYNGDRSGWVVMNVSDFSIDCLEYHNMMGECRRKGRGLGVTSQEGSGGTGATPRPCYGGRSDYNGVVIIVPC